MNNSQIVPVNLTVEGLQRERIITDIIRLMLWEKDDRGKNYTITKACEEAGIAYNTWKKWVEDGFVSAPLRAIAGSISQVAYDNVLPHYEQMIKNVVALASGRRPEGSDITEIKAADMLAAFKLLQQIIPVQPIDQAQGEKSEMEHVDTFVPKQLHIHYHQGDSADFLYRGGGEQRFGELGSLKDEIEGEVIEIEVD